MVWFGMKGYLMSQTHGWIFGATRYTRIMAMRFLFLAPVIQYGKYGCALTLEQLGRRWGWARQDGLPLYNMEIAVVAK